jgi:hypothetical protein
MGRQTQAKNNWRAHREAGLPLFTCSRSHRQQRAPPLSERINLVAPLASYRAKGFLFMSLSQRKARKTRLLRRKGLVYHTVYTVSGASGGPRGKKLYRTSYYMLLAIRPGIGFHATRLLLFPSFGDTLFYWIIKTRPSRTPILPCSSCP